MSRHIKFKLGGYFLSILAETHGKTVKFLCRDNVLKEKYDLLP